MMRSIVVLAAAAASGLVLAQDDRLEEIIVTAEFRGDELLRVPASVTVLGRDTIGDAGVQHFEDLLGQVPNINYSGETSRPRFFQLRGIGERSQYEGAPNPSVGFLVDDIDFSGIGMVATLFDAEQIEVLRGPQGTRYGANALAGLVYMRTREPTDEFELHTELATGNDDARAAGIAFGGPFAGAWSYRLTAHQWRSDGFRRNAFLGRADTNRRDELTTRGKLSYRPSERLGLDLTLMHVDLDNGYDAWTLDNSFTTHTDRPGRDSQRSRAGSVRLNWRPAAAFRVLSISSFADSDIVHSFDGDWGNEAFWGDFWPFDFFARRDRHRRTWSQEVRLLSEPGAGLWGGRAAWIAGVYALNLDERNTVLDLFNQQVHRQLASDYEALSAAAFGRLDIALTERLDLSAGLRFERRGAEYTDSQGVAFDPTESMLGGALTVSYAPAERWTVYGSLSRGYKAGGFNIGLHIPEERREFDTEFLWSLETGIKGRWLEGRLQSNVALFYMRRRDQQVNTSVQTDPTDPLTFVFFTDNAARGFNQGLEGDVRWRFLPAWSVFGSVGLLRTRYSRFAAGPEGREQAHAPRYQYAAGIEYRNATGWFARIEAAGRDAFYFSDSHDQRSSAHDLIHARLGWESERLSVHAWGRNLLNETYDVRGFFFGLEPPTFQERLYVRRGDPRHYGVTLRFRL